MLLILINRADSAIAIGLFVALGGFCQPRGPSSLYDMVIALYTGATIPLSRSALHPRGQPDEQPRGSPFGLDFQLRDGVDRVVLGRARHWSISACPMVFAEISGSAVADVAQPEPCSSRRMKKRGLLLEPLACRDHVVPLRRCDHHSRRRSRMFLYGAIAETYVLQAFRGGVVPGVLGGFLLMLGDYTLRSATEPAARRGLSGTYVWPCLASFRARSGRC